MRRYKNLFQDIIKIENIRKADKKARRGKLKQHGVQKHLQNQENNLEILRQSIINGSVKTSDYKTFICYDGKERLISRLPYYPDRVYQHSLVNILEPVFYKIFSSDSYSCIKGRGVHKASYNLRKYLKDIKGTKYCLKLDIEKFYPSVDNNILKIKLRRKFKDEKILRMLDEIIDSNQGLPLGNITSQFFANYYLTWFDRFIREDLKVRYYLRYADDMVLLSNNKEHLHESLKKIENYLSGRLNLKVKSNYQVFPVESRGIDFVGYVHYHTHTLIRKSIKQRYKKSKNKRNHNGWLIHCDSKNLRRKYEVTTNN